MLLIVWLPIPLGSNRPPYWTLAEIWIALLLMVWLIQYLRGRQPIPSSFRKAWPFYLPLALWCAWIALQTVPMPVSWVSLLSPNAVWVHKLSFRPDAQTGWLTLSVEPFSTRIGLFKSIFYLLLSCSVLLLVDNAARLRRLAYALVAAGLVQVLLGIVELNIQASFSGRRISAGFANPNHLANHLTLCIAAGLGLMIASLKHEKSRYFKESVRSALDWLMSNKMRLRFALLIMAAVVILTRSRMGNVAFFSSMMIAGFLMLLLSRQRKRGVVVLLSSMIAIDFLIVGSLLGVEQVAQRLEDTSLVAETRDELARDGIEYWRDFPLVGSGLGTYYATLPRYKQGDIPLFYRQAHNDYLQFAAETGLVGVALLGSALLTTLFAALGVLRSRRNPLTLGIAFSVVMAICAAMIHAIVEFNMQILATAATLVVILAMGWVAFSLPRGGAQPVIEETRSRRGTIIAALMIGALLFFGYQVIRMAGSETISQHNEKLLARWHHNKSAPAQQVQTAIRSQLDAIQLAPDNADAKLLLARLSWWQLPKVAQHDEGTPVVNDETVYQQMLYTLLAATRDNPGIAETWLAIATVQHYRGKYDGLFLVALQRSAMLAPWEKPVQRAVARIGLNAWDDMSGTLPRTLVAKMLQRGLQLDEESILDLVERSGRREQLCAEHARNLPNLSCVPSIEN